MSAKKTGGNWTLSPGYYWAKWRIASDNTHEADELTPSDEWEIVQVNDNNGEPGSGEELSVSVPGVREVQWPDCFVWGARVADLGAGPCVRCGCVQVTRDV